MDKNNSPGLCHLLQNDKIEYRTDLCGSLEKIKEYVDESHLWRDLKRCKKCGQLFFFEFYEWIDWEDGNDPQYDTWIPVKDEQEAEALNQKDSFGLLLFFGLHRSQPSNVPIAPSHAKLCNKPTGEYERFLTANCSAIDIYNAQVENIKN